MTDVICKNILILQKRWECAVSFIVKLLPFAISIDIYSTFRGTTAAIAYIMDISYLLFVSYLN